MSLLLATAASAEKLTPDRAYADPDLSGPRARGVKLSPDGALVTYLKPKAENQRVTDLWAAKASGGAPFRLVDGAALSPQGRDLSEAEKARRERQGIQSSGVVDYSWDSEGRFILVPVQGDVWIYERASAKVRQLTKTPADEIDAILLAYAGLKRLGLGHLPKSLIDPVERPPAPGQGALAIETREKDRDLPWVRAIRHEPTVITVAAERGALTALEASCKTAIGAHAWLEGGVLKLVVEALSSDGRERFRHAAETEVARLAEPEASAHDLGISLGLAVKEAAGDAIGR